jgi:hypothetical protein
MSDSVEVSLRLEEYVKSGQGIGPGDRSDYNSGYVRKKGMAWITKAKGMYSSQ